MSYSAQQAEVIALQALGWLSGQDDLMMTFLGATGADLDDLRTRAADPDFLASVMDFILMDDDWVRGFCDENTIAYSDIQPIRMALPGGALPNWT
jgi:uncharacterized protein DUF3572